MGTRNLTTWPQLAQEAWDVQNACNLSGVAHSFARVVGDVRALLESEGPSGNEALHAHPVVRLWADKIASLTGTQYSTESVEHAYAWLRTQGVK
jgi:hypothetical protein